MCMILKNELFRHELGYQNTLIIIIVWILIALFYISIVLNVKTII